MFFRTRVAVLTALIVALSGIITVPAATAQPDIGQPECRYSPNFTGSCRSDNAEPASHGGTHALSGTITHNGSPVEGVSVFLTDAATLQIVLPDALSASDGTYSLLVEPGNYYVMTADEAGRYVSEFHDGAIRYTESSPINISSDKTLDLAVRNPVGTISGTVTHNEGHTVSNATVVAVATLDDFNLFSIAKSSFNVALTDINGNYTISGLPSGNYYVFSISGPSASWHGTDLWTADPINDGAAVVAAVEGSDTAGVEMTVDSNAGGWITGVVVGPGLNPVEGICTEAVRTSDLTVIRTDTTDNDGNFTLAEFADTDRFYLRLVDCTRDVYVTEWFPGVTGTNPAGAAIYRGDEIHSIVTTIDIRFTDIDSSIFFDDIIWLAGEGITRGCNADRTEFCPNRSVTRGQMAAFLVRALNLTEHDNTIDFTDDDTSIFETDIEKLATAGITKGCGDGTTFCPNQSVTRGQMAAFLVRSYQLTAVDPAIDFNDDNTSVFETDIEKLATAGITKGCGDGTTFCPNQSVTRGQMAAFLRRAAALP